MSDPRIKPPTTPNAAADMRNVDPMFIAPAEHDGEPHRELYALHLFRILQACIIIGLTFSPLVTKQIEFTDPWLARVNAIAYLLLTLIAFSYVRRKSQPMFVIVTSAMLVDIVACSLMLLALSDPINSIAMLLMVNIGASAVLLTPRMAFFFAAVATMCVLAQNIYKFLEGSEHSPLELGLIGLGYFATALLSGILGKQMRATQQLATQRGLDLANLALINELIIRRIKTGVLVVDSENRVHRMNEAARNWLGAPKPGVQELAILSAELATRLGQWRQGQKNTSQPISAEDGSERIPRFTRLTPQDDNGAVLIFLDDNALLSRRAEELTLASLGRLSASIAHEIRNPLAAIQHAAQLLAESEELAITDQHLVGIVINHCGRLNQIIEHVRQLARREPSRPEPIELNRWVQEFITDYSTNHVLGADQLRAVPSSQPVNALIDPQQLQQVLWNLVQNALRYGRMPEQSASVSISARRVSPNVAPIIEIIDRGPGIPSSVATRIFEPFYTTHELGTGLGLYLAREMCESNQGTLDYVARAGGGSCFRITLSPAPG
jgi:two-component system sensor histidine kinase PilS (NtrC family)